MPEISNYLHDPVLLYKYDKRRVWALHISVLHISVLHISVLHISVLHISVLLPVSCVWREPSGN